VRSDPRSFQEKTNAGAEGIREMAKNKVAPTALQAKQDVGVQEMLK